MPRRGRSSPPPRAPAPPSRSSSSYAPAPQHAPPPAPPAVIQQQPQQPGLLKQMAATAGGVAVGSAVGHTIGHAMTGMFSGGGSEVQSDAPQQQQAAHYGATEQNGPCSYEIKQFLQCAENQSDLTLCDGFNEAIRQCKRQYNI